VDGGTNALPSPSAAQVMRTLPFAIKEDREKELDMSANAFLGIAYFMVIDEPIARWDGRHGGPGPRKGLRLS
jgi:hypothetical protein